jgi:hypothetical protein
VVARRRTTWIIAGLALALGVAIRVHNAFHYRMLWGFDALYNWGYIQRLMGSWELPPPDAAWSTAHPPFFYYVSAAICRGLDNPSRSLNVIVLRLLITVAGLSIVWLAVALIRRTDPGNQRRALLAGGLLLFLPVHIYMSAMLTEEIVAASLISLVLVGVGLELGRDRESYRPLRYAASMGIAAGLALLTKLTGVLVMVAAAGAYLLAGWRRGALRPALSRAAIVLLLAAMVGGWYYARNLVRYGYLYPYGLKTHRIMFTMPPGDRRMGDYLRVPFATWTDPQVLHPDLLRSIWGSTYVTVWFDGHRVFLPTDTAAVTRVGTAILLLALLPTSAFVIGLLRGLRRTVRSPGGPDAILLLMVAITLAGYVAFTWRNPWFVATKGSFLLGLSVPFAYYASEVLDGWTREGGRTSIAIWIALAVLVVLITGTFTFSELFWNTHHMKKPGVVW